MKREILSEIAMRELGRDIGRQLKGGEVIELIGDVGAGKTTLTKGIAAGLGIEEDVQSPSFTISRTYQTAHPDIAMTHYDFYRLHDPGIMARELDEAIRDLNTVTIVEWAEIVQNVLPDDHIRISITPTSETTRHVVLEGVEL